MKKQGWRGMSDVEKHIEKEALKIMEEGIDFKKLLQDSKRTTERLIEEIKVTAENRASQKP